jgi:class 3 adenylate cyclase/CHASE2 domain-containing sensor protein
MARPTPLHKDIVVVTVTEDALADNASYAPLDRALLARLITHVDALGARAIGLDVLLDRPTRPRDDARLRKALENAKARIVLAAPEQQDKVRTPAFFATMTRDLETGAAEIIIDAQDSVTRIQRPFDENGAPRTLAAKLSGLEKGSPAPMRVPFKRAAADPEAWPFLSFQAHHLLDVPVTEDLWLQDARVLIGADIEDIDQFSTPLQADHDGDATFPGVAIHAYHTAQLMDKARLTVLPDWASGLFIFMTALVGLVGLYKARSARRGIATLVAGPIAILLFALFAFQWTQVLLPVIAPALSFVLASVGGGSLAANTHRADAGRSDRAFRNYLDPKIIDTLMRQPARLPVAPAERDIAVLICALEGFTSMTARADPETLGKLISPYFETIIKTIITHSGVIDKLTGDGALALFGAVAQDDQRRTRAVNCAIALDLACEGFRAQDAARALNWGATRIGVHAGPALVGSFGGRDRLHFTALRPTVNLAARLEQANKHSGERVLISANAAPEVMLPLLRPVGRLRLRGAMEPLMTFGLRDPGHDLVAYRAAIAALPQDAAAAAIGFEKALKAAPDDALARFHLARLQSGECGDEITLP